MFTIKDTKFRNSLQKMQEQFGGKVAFRITVPPEMVWWYWQEFGTASYAEKGSGSPAGYRIPLEDFGYLKYYDRALGDFRIASHVFTLGIPSHHMVTDVLPEIQLSIKTNTIRALKESGYSFAGLQSALLEQLMPHVKELIRASFALKLDKPVRPLVGDRPINISGTAEAEFEAKATIVDTST